MHSNFEKNYFLVIHALLNKYNKNRLPHELVVDIKDRCVKVRKECRQEFAKQIYGKGQTKSSAKRRARRYERCFKCGKFSHDGACPKNQTDSNYEYLQLIRNGPFECKTEQTLNKKGYAYRRMKQEILRLKEEAIQIGINL